MRALLALLLLLAPLGAATGQRAAETQRYRPRPAIWMIADKDTTIYLFGTMHVLPPGFRWRSAAFDRVVARSDTLLLESVESDPRGLPVGAPSKGDPTLPPLVDRISPRYRALLVAFQKTLPAEAVTLMDGMPTWVAALSIEYVRDLRAGETLAPGADDWLEAHFRAAGKRVEAIEDSGAVVKRVNAIPEPDQRRMLEAALLAEPRTLRQLRAPAHAWARGDVGPRSPLAGELGAGNSPALQDPLVTRRNAQWAERLEKRLRRPGTVLFAAGVGHFVGKGSVIELLEARGLKVTRVE